MNAHVDPLVVNVEHLAQPILPIFLRRWFYHPERIDARPVIWSLYERPQDWTYKVSGIGAPFVRCYWFRHEPSGHAFLVSDRVVSAPLAKCGCDARQWQPLQTGAIRRAFWRFIARDKGVPESIDERIARRWFMWRARRHDWVDGENDVFASHFVR